MSALDEVTKEYRQIISEDKLYSQPIAKTHTYTGNYIDWLMQFPPEQRERIREKIFLNNSQYCPTKDCGRCKAFATKFFDMCHMVKDFGEKMAARSMDWGLQNRNTWSSEKK